MTPPSRHASNRRLSKPERGVAAGGLETVIEGGFVMMVRATRPPASRSALAERVNQGQLAAKRAAARAKTAAQTQRRRVG